MDIVRSRQFGKLARRHRLEKGLTQADVAGRAGPHPETGKWLNATQVSRVEAGMKEMDRWLIERIIEIVEMDPDEGWEAATGAPPGFTAEGYRKVLADARADQATDGRVRGSTRPCAPHLRLARPHPAPSRIGVAVGIAVGALAPAA